MAQVVPNAVVVPVRVRVKTAYGTLFMHLTHYESGRAMAELKFDKEPSVQAMKTGGLYALRDIEARVSAEKLADKLLTARPIANGCTPCGGTGFATVGGPCILCKGSGNARKPKP